MKVPVLRAGHIHEIFVSDSGLISFSRQLRSFRFGGSLRKRLVCNRLWCQRMQLLRFETMYLSFQTNGATRGGVQLTELFAVVPG